jgi:hypothetical protein
MEITKLRQRLSAAPAMVAFLILAAPIANAQCGATAQNGGMSIPGLSSLQDPAAIGQEPFSEPEASPQAQDQDARRTKVTVLGLWKKLEYVGGAVVDIAFAQYNAGGTELTNDTGPSGGGNNFCIGAWKRIGTRTYEQVHTFFCFRHLRKSSRHCH